MSTSFPGKKTWKEVARVKNYSEERIFNLHRQERVRGGIVNRSYRGVFPILLKNFRSFSGSDIPGGSKNG